MQLGMVGLGRMGANMARRLKRDGHDLVVFDLDATKVAELKNEGMQGSTDLKKFVDMLTKPRAAWLMVPAGEPTETMVNKFSELFESGDVLIDGGNSYYKDDVRRAKMLRTKGIEYVDAGTSGGRGGADRRLHHKLEGDQGWSSCHPVLRNRGSASGESA